MARVDKNLWVIFLTRLSSYERLFQRQLENWNSENENRFSNLVKIKELTGIETWFEFLVRVKQSMKRIKQVHLFKNQAIIKAYKQDDFAFIMAAIVHKWKLPLAKAFEYKSRACLMMMQQINSLYKVKNAPPTSIRWMVAEEYYWMLTPLVYSLLFAQNQFAFELAKASQDVEAASVLHENIDQGEPWAAEEMVWESRYFTAMDYALCLKDGIAEMLLACGFSMPARRSDLFRWNEKSTASCLVALRYRETRPLDTSHAPEAFQGSLNYKS
ncbi:MAG: hypothetical protein K0S08_409 [Gammaproteobacteria bacterium]|nr:hypothetical protein [Gammaproteobacteria bacterium]